MDSKQVRQISNGKQIQVIHTPDFELVKAYNIDVKHKDGTANNKKKKTKSLTITFYGNKIPRRGVEFTVTLYGKKITHQ